MKRRGRVLTHHIRLILCTALLLVLAVATAHAEYFTIDRFHSRIVVNEDASIDVTESIGVTFHRSRHGIYRDIPYKYRTDLGQTMRMPIEVISVTDGRSREWPTQVSHTGNVVHIRIGDPDIYVDGPQEYVITYRVENALLFFDDHDELYWNVTGDEWEAEITEASAEIRLPQSADSNDFTYGCYTGRRGSTETDCHWGAQVDGATFWADHPLHQREGFTIALGWPKGIVKEPSAWQRFLWRIDVKDNWPLVVPLLAMIIMFRLWWTRGRDPKVREATTVQYDPPQYNGKPITPAETGSLIDERLDPRDITASVISLAVKGYLEIEESEQTILIFKSTDYKLTKRKDADADLGEFEFKLHRALFKDGSSSIMVSELKNKFYRNLPTLKSSVQSMLMNKKYFTANPDRVRQKYVLYGFLTGIATFLAGMVTGSASFPLVPIIAAALSAGIVIMFGGVMPAKTKAGALALSHLRGFQEFMERVEKDHIERMKEKDVFYRYLPYAIALEVADQWSKAFEGLYNEPPNWYRSSHGFAHFSTSAFAHSVTAATSSIGSAMYSAPRSSGTSGGGGGSSGGGGGGGGGGSW